MYEVRLTRQFVRATKKEDLAVLRATIEEIANDPYHAAGSHALSHEWAGFRGADFSRNNRFVFRVCEECVRNHQENLKPLACCDDPGASKRIVTFIDFGDYHATAGRRRLRPASNYEVPSASDSC